MNFQWFFESKMCMYIYIYHISQNENFGFCDFGMCIFLVIPNL